MTVGTRNTRRLLRRRELPTTRQRPSRTRSRRMKTGQVRQQGRKDRHSGVLPYFGEPNVFTVKSVCPGEYKQGVRYYKVYWAADDLKPSWEPEYNLTKDWLRYTPRGTGRHTVLPPCQKKLCAVMSRSTKIEANNLFVNYLLESQKNGRLGSGRILVLDCVQMNTCRVLSETCIPNTRVPVNFDVATVQYWLSKPDLPLNTDPFYGSLFQAITTPTYPLAAVWFDYCCTIRGTETTVPWDDINALFQSRRLQTSSVVAFTFCLRDNRTKGRPRDQITHFHRRLLSYAKRWRWKFGLQHTFRYHPAMVFLLYSVNSF